ncbi:MAG: DUF1350 family protein [Alkalinema sp. RU_4_3]|nr:DUF1350 family protein [Alkalinema sp. RU_4_3]
MHRGAFFGSFPTLFYRHFLESLFDEGYTIIALPFRFSFRHWPIAIDLFREQEMIRRELLSRNLPGQEIYADKSKYAWIGHSLGCKYIALLEFLSTQTVQQSPEVTALIAAAGLEEVSIFDQPSLLLAPDISDTESAIPVKAIAQFIDQITVFGIPLGAHPKRQETQEFIQRSNLFNLTALISFQADTVAGSLGDRYKDTKTRANSDVLWFFEYFNTKAFPILHQELPGKHLEPVGLRFGQNIVDLNPLDKFIAPLATRKLEKVAIEFLSKLASHGQEEQRLPREDKEVEHYASR